MNINVLKKDGTIEKFDFNKILNAVKKSANRVNHILKSSELKKIRTLVDMDLEDLMEIHVEFIHGIVEKALTYVNKDVANSYINYRNYKKEFELPMIRDIERQVDETLNGKDRSNSNSNSDYNSTKRTAVAKIFAKEMYQKMHLSTGEIQAMKDGFIYAHDLDDLLIPQYNCGLTDVKTILDGGFELENSFYTEPKDIITAVGQVGAIIKQISGQHYGGLTVPEIDKTLAKYYKMSYELHKKEDLEDYGEDECVLKIDKIAKRKAYRDLKQSIQGIEMELNTVGSSRGSYPFTTFTFGRASNNWEADISKAILEVRMEGHGKSGFKKNMIFPKLVFIHDENLHGENREFEWLFDLSIKCTSENMYPDYIGKGHIREDKVVSPMGKIYCPSVLTQAKAV